MRFGKISLAAIAAVSMVAAPIVAQAAPAVERAATELQGESKLKGSTGIILALLAAAAIIAGIVVAADNEDDLPTSP